MPKEISLHKNYFDTTVRNAKTGNRTENRTRTNRKILWANEPACQEKFTYIKNFSMRPSEKPEPGLTKNFYVLTGMSIQICMHWNFFDRINRYKDIDYRLYGS